MRRFDCVLSCLWLALCGRPALAAKAASPAASAARAQHGRSHACTGPDCGAEPYHIDRDAGVKFLVPFHGAKDWRGSELDALLRRRLGVRSTPELRYTSAVTADTDALVVVWTKPEGGGVTRQLADELARSAGKASPAAGLRGFVFDRRTLQGEGSLADAGPLRNRVLLQLVRDRKTFIGFYYRTPAQLRDFDVIKRSLIVGKLSHLSYAELPATWLATMLRLLAIAGGVFFLGAGVGGGAVAAYRRMGRDPVPPGTGAGVATPYGEDLTAGGGGPAGRLPVISVASQTAQNPLPGL